MLAAQLKESIARGNLDAVFTELNGLAPEVERSRYIKIIDRFIADFGNKEVALFSAPGRSEICGNHTDHQNGKVLAAAVNADIIAVAAKNNGGVIRLNSIGFEPVSVNTAVLVPQTKEVGRSSALVRGVTAGMHDIGKTIGGFDCVTLSNVPSGSGLSSSAALEVLVVKIIDCLFNDDSVSAVESAKISQAAECNFFGKPCGLMDQTACASGGFVYIDFRDLARPAVEKIDVDLSGYSLFVVGTGGSHAKLTDQYAAIREEMTDVAKRFGHEVLRECSEEEFYANLGKLGNGSSELSDRALLRAMHFFAENRRVDGAAAALKKGDIAAFFRAVNESGDSSAMLLQNAYSPSNPEEQGINLGVALARHVLRGEGASRLQGGGFAGTVIAFVPDGQKQEFVDALSSLFADAPKFTKEFHVRALGPTRLRLQ